jgi:predicted RNA-binding protein YlxR (DUF448 family)
MKNKRVLIRIVKTPADEIIIDPTGKKAGRGAYLCASEECFNKAVKEKRLERSLKQAIAAEVYENLRQSIGTE